MTTHDLTSTANATTYEPSSLEVFITVAAGNLFGRIYKAYVDRLGLQGNEKVLDFGSGSGNPARFIAPILLRDGGTLTCVDVSRTWLDIARGRLRCYPNVEFKLGDIASLDLPAGAYDVVFVHFVLHDIGAAERPRIVQHLARVLNGTGGLHIREPLRFITAEEIRRLMEQSSLREVQSRTAQVPTQGMVYEGVFRAQSSINHRSITGFEKVTHDLLKPVGFFQKRPMTALFKPDERAFRQNCVQRGCSRFTRIGVVGCAINDQRFCA